MVVGLGLIGLVAAQLLRANGCKVIGVDFDQQKVDMAASKGIVAVNPGRGTDPVRFVEDYTGGYRCGWCLDHGPPRKTMR